MKIDVPFLYLADVVARGRRKPQRVRLLSQGAFEVRELAGRDVPLAAVVECPRHSADSRPVPPEHRRLEYRLLDGKLVRPVEICVGDGHAPWERVTPANVADVLERWRAHALAAVEGFQFQRHNRVHVPFLLGSPQWSGPILPEAAAEGMRREWDDKEARAARLAGVLAGRVAVVDGVLYGPTLGPVWVVANSAVHEGVRDGHDRWRTRHYLQLHHEAALLDDESRRNAYRLDKLAEAEAHLQRRFEAARADGFVGERVGRVVELHPERLPGDDLGRALLAAARATANSCDGILARMPTAAIRAYADLRDTLASADGEAVDQMTFDSVLVLACELRDHVRAYTGRAVRDDPVAAFERRLAVARGAAPEEPQAVVLGADDLRQMGLM